MTRLTEQELEFARRHLQRFEDSDFFPENVAYQSIWANWNDVRDRLMAANIVKLPIAAATSMPVAKGKSTYRIVHQLDPITCIVYTALIYRVAPAIEGKRIPPAEKIACSNRYRPDDGSFFSEGTGYEHFREKSHELSQQFSFGATADISDFYNQIYSHRVRASIEASDRALEDTARDLEAVIHSINAGASKGIPVGPVASGVIAEAIMMDVDQLMTRNGFIHTRYVDDIRIFSNNVSELQAAIEVISEYLYDNHRLHLNSGKTSIYSIDEFKEKVIKDHIDEETKAAINRISEIDLYDEEIELDPDDVPDEEIIDEIGGIILNKFQVGDFVDLNLIKAYIRRARLIDSTLFVQVAQVSLDAFVPVFHELAKAMDAACRAGNSHEILPLIEAIMASDFYRRTAVRRWTDWVCAGSAFLLGRNDIRQAVFSGEISSQARAAKTMNDHAWVRSHRANYLQLPPLARASVMDAMSILGKDERRAILGQIDDNYAHPIDVAIKRHLLAHP